MKEVGATQQSALEDANTAQLYLSSLRALFAAERCHLARKSPSVPEDVLRATGWRMRDYTLEPCGRLIGWTDGDGIYLIPEAAHAEVQGLEREQGGYFPLSSAATNRCLRDKGLLVRAESSRQRCTVRISVDGVRHDVLHLPLESVVSLANPTVPTVPQDQKPYLSNGLQAGTVSRDGEPRSTVPDNGTVDESQVPTSVPADRPMSQTQTDEVVLGVVGRLGRQSDGIADIPTTGDALSNSFEVGEA